MAGNEFSNALADDAGTATNSSNALGAHCDDAGTANTSQKALGTHCDDTGTATTASKALGAPSDDAGTATNSSKALGALSNTKTATNVSKALGTLAVAQRHISASPHRPAEIAVAEATKLYASAPRPFNPPRRPHSPAATASAPRRRASPLPSLLRFSAKGLRCSSLAHVGAVTGTAPARADRGISSQRESVAFGPP